MPVHVVGISATHIWHTIRNNGGGWEPWTDVLTLTGPLANGQPSRVGCAMVDGQLHVGIAHGLNQLSHTIRFGPAAWQSWGTAAAAGFATVNDPEGVSCAGIGTSLHVCVAGNRLNPPLQTLPAVWHSARMANTWTASVEVTNRYRIVLEHALASATNCTSWPVVDRLPPCCRSSRACKAVERTLPEPRLRQRARPDCAT